MIVGQFKAILKNCNDDAELMLVTKIGDMQLDVENIIAIAPADDANFFEYASSFYLYGDSCDFIEHAFDYCKYVEDNNDC